jgi:hypothetical protein
MENKIIESILKINPKAEVVVRGNDINTCEIEWLNGTTPISKSEIEAMIPIVEQEIANQEAQAKANKQSALNKLKTLGLTDAEIKAIIG